MADPNMSMADGSEGTGVAPTVIPKATIPKTAKATPVAPKVLPLYDPANNMLRAIPADRAKEFADMGWKVGGDAEVAALNNSKLAQTAAASAGLANSTSAGAFDALLSTNHSGKDLLKTEQIARENNPLSSLAGSVAGVAATGAAGGFGGIAEGGLAKIAAQGGAKGLAARGASIALQGAPYMAVQGVMDTVTQDNLLNHPITAQQLAAGAFHNVVDNAAINVVGHGILKSASGIRKATGASMDYLEKWSALPREVEEIPHDYGAAGKPKEKVTQTERTYSTAKPAEPLGPDYQLTSEAGEDGAAMPSGPIAPHGAPMGESPMVGKLSDAIDAHPAPNMSAVQADPSLAPVDGIAGPSPTEPIQPNSPIPAHYPEWQPPIEMPRKPMREPSAVGSAREQLEKVTAELDGRSERATTAREAADEAHKTVIGRADAPAVEAAKTPSVDAADVEPEFEWKKGISPRGKRLKLREMIKERLADAHPDGPKKWDKIKALEDEMTAIDTTPGFPNKDAVISAKRQAKQQLKEELKVLAPREVDKEANVFKPGFEDYDNEYARTYGKDRLSGDIATPTFGPKGEGGADSVTRAANASELHETRLAAQETRAHEAAIKKADAADAAVSNHEIKLAHAEKKLARLEAAFETNKSDTKTVNQAKHERDVTLSKRAHNERIRQMQARDAARAERKAASEAVAKAKADAKQIRELERKAEKSAKDASVKAERAQRQAKADREKAAKYAESQAKKSAPSKTTKEKETREYTTSEGVHTETRERHIKGDQVRERITIKVKPHEPPPSYRRGNYKYRWSGTDFANVAKAGFYSGMPHLAGWAAGGMAAHNAAIGLARNREAIGKAWQKYMGALAKGGSIAYKAKKRGEMHEHSGSMDPATLSPKDYPKLAKAIGYLSQNPEAITNYMQRTHPNLAAQKPELVASVGVNIQKGINQIYQMMPKKPFDPTLQNENFLPTRSQQVAVLRMWQALGNPKQALAYGDHTVFSGLDTVYPDLQEDGRNQLLHEIQNTKTPLRGRKARQMSQFIGAPVRPLNAAQALKRMQQTAGPEPMKPPGQGKPIGAGGKSAKVTQQATQRDMPAGSLSMLGG